MAGIVDGSDWDVALRLPPKTTKADDGSRRPAAGGRTIVAGGQVRGCARQGHSPFSVGVHRGLGGGARTAKRRGRTGGRASGVLSGRGRRRTTGATPATGGRRPPIRAASA